MFKSSLEPDRSDAVKICTMKACITIIEDVCASSYVIINFSHITLTGIEMSMATTTPKAHGHAEDEIWKCSRGQSLPLCLVVDT